MVQAPCATDRDKASKRHRLCQREHSHAAEATGDVRREVETYKRQRPDRQTDRRTERDRDRERQGETERDRERQTETDRDRQRERETETARARATATARATRQRQTETERVERGSEGGRDGRALLILFQVASLWRLQLSCSCRRSDSKPEGIWKPHQVSQNGTPRSQIQGFHPESQGHRHKRSLSS